MLGSEAILVGGVDSTAVGALYTRANATSPFRIQRCFEQVSQLVNPMRAASFEPFQWQGRRFASDIVLDGGRGPGNFPAELWMVDLDSGATSLLSTPTRLNRMGPEFFLGTHEIFILFYARSPTGPGFRLYRARTGLTRP